MLGTLLADSGTMQLALLVLLAVCCLVFVLKRMFRAAIGAFILAVVVPLFVTILLGDGASYMETLTRFLPGNRQELVMDAYDYFRDKEERDPVVDYQALKDALESIEKQVDNRYEGENAKQGMSHRVFS